VSPPVITALRERGRRVAVDLDGARWRVLPVDVIVRAELHVGQELDRTRARTVRRELRRSEALARATRAVAVRARSEHELNGRLARAGFAAAERSAAVGTLARAGYVDDARLAVDRAQALAGRGYGDAAIRHDLESRGIAGELVDLAVGGLPGEGERAAVLVARRGPGPATARFLARRGFGEDAIADATLRVADDS
jgi:SOS response regulatory protein OraA/RecX